MRTLFIFLYLAIVSFQLKAQETFPVNGVQDTRGKLVVFTHANIVISGDSILRNANLIIQDGNILAIGTATKFPANAVINDVKGNYIYPAFIDLYSDYGISKPAKTDRGNYEQMLSKKKGAYDWNQAVHPETNAAELFVKDGAVAKHLRQCGFGAVLTHQADGIVRGSGCLVSLTDESEQKALLQAEVSANFSFSKGSSSQDYPSSLMGSIALLRQTYYDAKWYAQLSKIEETNLSLAAFNRLSNKLQVFQAEQALNLLRADKIAKEFNVKYVLKTNGTEYQRIAAIKATGSSLIVPINFPKAFDLNDPIEAMNISWTEMKSWELAPYNLFMIDTAKMDYVITSYGCKSAEEFWKNLRNVIKCGLTEQKALCALTVNPAKLIGMNAELGSLAIGKVANFFICSNRISEEKNVVFQNWVQGVNYEVKEMPLVDRKGVYTLKLNSIKNVQLIIDGAITAPEFRALVPSDSSKLKVVGAISKNSINFSFNYPKDSSSLVYRFTGLFEGQQLKGQVFTPQGDWLNVTADFMPIVVTKKDSNVKVIPAASIDLRVPYPFNAYGWWKAPTKSDYVIRNATVWTNEDAGVLTETDVWVKNGKIKAVGKSLTVTESEVEINGKGMHLTSGIMDEHSHIAASGDVNEGTQSVTSEVRIGDIINSEDINIYRQLSGGVTSSHILHGSANAIGGQTQLIKLRWGLTPEEMKFKEAPGYIKFALGENVKQANWGDFAVTRFPQTRMGVEQVYQNAFSRACAYEKEMRANAVSGKGIKTPVRRDLELDALVEIMQSKRFITCHSYVQSEINMLMHVADSFHFKINTFTHILEGYKVADKMRLHGVRGASTFADWWAYKLEVMEAIPQNAGLMHQAGITVAVNSDDPEMGRRLNQEVAKSIKYTGMSELEAWKMCTLNPAILMRVAAFTGSIKEGKDADLVLWSDNPLSVYAVVQKTFVDGICYYDLQEDLQKRQFIQKDKARLTAKMIQAKKEGESTLPATKSPENHYYNCEGTE